MVDTQLLDEKIEQSGLKLNYICKVLGLSPTGFNKKRKGKTPFRKSEMYVLCDLLQLDGMESTKIFYPES